MAPQGSAIAPAPPAGWQPGVDGKAMLGGAQPQVPTSSDGTPLKPPPPPQTYNDPMSVYKWARKQGYSPDVAIAAMKESMVIADAHNQEMLQAAERENYSQQAAEHAAKAAKAKWDEEHPKEGTKTTIEKEAERLQELEAQGKGNTTEAKALKAHIARMDRMPGAPGSAGGAPAGSESREANAAQVATGQPLNQVVAGYGKDVAAKRVQAHDDAIKQIMKDEGMSAPEAGRELARRSVDFLAGKSSVTQLTKMQGATRQAVQQLDFNVDKVTSEMAKLKGSDISPVINALVRGEEKWTGEPAYSSLFYYMNAAATESARLLSGGQASAAQLHQGAMEEAMKWANINMTPASWGAVAKSMKDEGNFRLKTYGDAIEASEPGGGRKTDAAKSGPKKGDVEDGFRFKGGDPAKKENWEKA